MGSLRQGLTIRKRLFHQNGGYVRASWVKGYTTVASVARHVFGASDRHDTHERMPPG
jgi:hypothetical protein